MQYRSAETSSNRQKRQVYVRLEAAERPLHHRPTMPHAKIRHFEQNGPGARARPIACRCPAFSAVAPAGLGTRTNSKFLHRPPCAMPNQPRRHPFIVVCPCGYMPPLHLAGPLFLVMYNVVCRAATCPGGKKGRRRRKRQGPR